MKERTAIGLILVLGLVAGCAQQSDRKGAYPPKSVAKVDKITIFSMPTAINLDNVPGPDALRVRVYLFQLARPEPVTVKGAMEFLLYEGRVSLSDLHTQVPYHVWRLDGERMNRYLSRGMAGWGYSMELRWAGHPPKSNVISLAVRYQPPEGESVYSIPSVISIGR
ncbi:MAG: hypothetical protein ACYSTL_00175 [Planctomycetota bacterium]|jgi:hypothetical protein